MTRQDDAVPAAGDPVRWYAVPQPTRVELRAGDWRPGSARVVAQDSAFGPEAARLRGELAALGIPVGDGATVRLRRADTGGEECAGEAFEITVGADVDVGAGTPAGVFRATRQLVHNLRAHGLVPHGRVTSAPAVAERGFHLDAARKHFGAEWIVALLHDLADVGINTFQWHLSENEGFRLESEAFGDLASAAHVTRAEARRVAEVADELHIDLVPSLDMPGHLKHVLDRRPELRLPPGGGVATDGALDITSEDAVRFSRALIDDVAALFPGSGRWNLGADEFVDFARMADHPTLARAATDRLGPGATGFDLLTDFVNRTAAHLAARGLDARVWNDGMLRGSAVRLDPGVALTWWTNWHAQMRPLADALAAGHRVVNFHDALFYYVLGEKAGYRYPTSDRIWAADWHPGLFPSLPGGVAQELARPYPPELIGASFSVWSDDADAQTPDEVAAGIRAPVRAMAERAWNGGSRLTHDEFRAVDTAIGAAGPSGAHT
jgi:hexosaminidase